MRETARDRRVCTSAVSTFNTKGYNLKKGERKEKEEWKKEKEVERSDSTWGW